MTYRIVFLPRAQNDLRDAARWIEQTSRSPASALRWTRSIRAKIETLKTFPQRCPKADESDAFGEEVRQLLHGKRRGIHRVLFVIRDDTIFILAVRHSAQGEIPS